MASRRLLALVKKESLQILRDPSAMLIAFVLPVLLLFLFAYAVSLDIRQLHLGVVLQTDSAQARRWRRSLPARPISGYGRPGTGARSSRCWCGASLRVTCSFRPISTVVWRVVSPWCRW